MADDAFHVAFCRPGFLQINLDMPKKLFIWVCIMNNTLWVVLLTCMHFCDKTTKRSMWHTCFLVSVCTHVVSHVNVYRSYCTTVSHKPSASYESALQFHRWHPSPESSPLGLHRSLNTHTHTHILIHQNTILVAQKGNEQIIFQINVRSLFPSERHTLKQTQKGSGHKETVDKDTGI